MKFIWQIEPHDIAKVQQFMVRYGNDSLVQQRIALNLSLTKPSVMETGFWQSLVFCLLTTQQRSGPYSAVTRFISTDPFPLSHQACAEHADVRTFVQMTLQAFGGVRFAHRLADQISNNFNELHQGLWTTTFNLLEQLRHEQTASMEQVTAHFIATHFSGFGPKQSRNLLQILGLSKYEIPIDSRITKWLNAFRFPIYLSSYALSDPNYYQFISEGFQQLCRESGVVPCLLDAAIFSSYDTEDWIEETPVDN